MNKLYPRGKYVLKLRGYYANEEGEERERELIDALEHLVSVSAKAPGVAEEEWRRALRKAQRVLR